MDCVLVLHWLHAPMSARSFFGLHIRASVLRLHALLAKAARYPQCMSLHRHDTHDALEQVLGVLTQLSSVTVRMSCCEHVQSVML